ncbi:MAG: RidA family protein [Candidatus Omnitrophota bacterium]
MIRKVMHAPEVMSEPTAYARPVPFSRGIRVDSGEAVFLFISGTASVDKKGNSLYPGDFAAQATRTYKNITALLSSEGADWDDVVRTTCYLSDMRHYEDFRKFRIEFYRKQGITKLPASTCVEAALCRPEFLVEVEAIAVLRK